MATRNPNPARRTELVDAIVDNFRAREGATWDQLFKLVPPGTRVSWTTERSGQAYRHYGRVTGQSRPVGRIHVLNEATGKYSVHSFGRYGTLRIEQEA